MLRAANGNISFEWILPPAVGEGSCDPNQTVGDDITLLNSSRTRKNGKTTNKSMFISLN